MSIPRNSSTLKAVPCDHALIKLDVDNKLLPLSVGIEVPGGRVQRVLERGIQLPHQQTELYSTADPYQMAAEFHIVMGERPLAQDCIDLCRIRVRNIKWSAAGEPKLEVAFHIDEEGNFRIAAANKDKKNTELLASIAHPHVEQSLITAALISAEEHKAEDVAHEANIETMLSGYYLMDQAYERYALAKRRMDFTRKRAYKASRKRLEKALNVMPPEATEDTMAELKSALEDFRATYKSMENDYRAVSSWWGK